MTAERIAEHRKTGVAWCDEAEFEELLDLAEEALRLKRGLGGLLSLYANESGVSLRGCLFDMKELLENAADNNAEYAARAALSPRGENEET